METDSTYEMDEETVSDSSQEIHASRKPHKGGKHILEEPTILTELLACPLAVACFKHQSCYRFCEMVERVKYQHELARLFVLHLHNGQVNLAGVIFTLTPETIVEATSIPNVGEQWNKGQLVGKEHYEPYVKASYQKKISTVFPFRYLQDTYASLMKFIIKYFTYEGGFLACTLTMLDY